MSRRFFYHLLVALPIVAAASFGIGMWQTGGRLLYQFEDVDFSFSGAFGVAEVSAQSCIDPTTKATGTEARLYYSSCLNRFRVSRAAVNSGNWADFVPWEYDSSGTRIYATKSIQNLAVDPSALTSAYTGREVLVATVATTINSLPNDIAALVAQNVPRFGFWSSSAAAPAGLAAGRIDASSVYTCTDPFTRTGCTAVGGGAAATLWDYVGGDPTLAIENKNASGDVNVTRHLDVLHSLAVTGSSTLSGSWKNEFKTQNGCSNFPAQQYYFKRVSMSNNGIIRAIVNNGGADVNGDGTDNDYEFYSFRYDGLGWSCNQLISSPYARILEDVWVQSNAQSSSGNSIVMPRRYQFFSSNGGTTYQQGYDTASSTSGGWLVDGFENIAIMTLSASSREFVNKSADSQPIACLSDDCADNTNWKKIQTGGLTGASVIAVGRYVAYKAAGTAGFGRLNLTVDSGFTWDDDGGTLKNPSSLGGGNRLDEVYGMWSLPDNAYSGTNALIIAVGSKGGGAGATQVAYSVNGGRNWQSGTIPNGANQNTVLHSVWGDRNGGDIFAVGTGGTIWKSTDQGASWGQTLAPGALTSETLYDVTGSVNSEGNWTQVVAVGKNAILSVGSTQASGSATIKGDLTVQRGNLKLETGDLRVDNNTPSGCGWENTSSNTPPGSCSAGKFMAGYKVGGGGLIGSDHYCCEL